MAKKLNKKVAIIGIVLIALMIAGGSGMFIALKIHRSPDRALKLSQQALEAGDYEEAEKQLGRSYAFGETDEYKIERLFELAEFHLINNDEHEANWTKTMGCWKKITSIDSQNLVARRKILDFYYQSADAGTASAWVTVDQFTGELIDILQKQGTEPDLFLLTARAKALLSVAQRGGTTDRREPLDESISLLNQLIEAEPQNSEYYQLMASAMTVEGELDALMGMIDAEKKAQEKALGFLETGVEQTDDPATAVADLMLFKMQTSANEPNALEDVRAEIDERSKEIQPNDKLWLVTSIAYETPGKLSAESEINRAIEAIRQAHELKPDDFEYTLRMAKLMYRKGNAFSDSDAIDDALQIAEDAMSLDEVQDVPGPLQGRNLSYRFTLNAFLADLYLEKALAAKELDMDTEVQDLVQKAEERIGEMVDALGSTDNPMVQKYQGFIALAKGEESEAIRLLYKAYEAGKALDQPGERSNVDSRVCVALAQIAKQQGQFGLQNQFLSGAFASRDGYLLQNPQLLLEYAQVAKQFGGWRVVKQLAQVYQGRYGANEQSRTLEIEASIALGEFDKAKELLSSYEGPSAEKSRHELGIVTSQTGRLKRKIALAEEEGEEPTPEQAQELEAFLEKRNALLAEVLKTSPKELDAGVVSGICADLIRNEKAQLAIEYLDMYLSVNPDVLNLMVLRLRAQQEDPMNLSSEERMQLREQAINSLSDPKVRALILANRYRSEGEYEKATQALEQNSQVDADDPDVVQLRFDLALEQKELETAESLQQIIRTENIDQCEGSLAMARLEMVKGNYQLALRRLDECESMRPLLSYTHYLRSEVQRQMEDEEGAIESAKKALSMDPQNASYARQMASLFFTRNTALGNKVTLEQRAEAERAVMMAIQLDPSDSQLQGVYSEIIKQRDPDQALLIRQRLLENNPSVSNAMMLGQLALEMAGSEWDAAKKTGLIELAGSAYQRGLEAEPDNQVSRQAYADYQQKTGKEDAIEMLGGDKNLEWKFYLRNSQFEQAEAILKDLLQEQPDDPLLIRGLVFAFQGMGNRDQVRDYLEMLSGLDETKETELWVIQKYIDNGFSAEAEKKLESFQERYPEEKSILLIAAWTQMGKGQLDEALVSVNRYLETDTNNAGAWRLRGRLYRLMNQPQKAIEDLQQSKEMKDDPAVRMELATVYDESKQATAAIGELASSLDDPQAPARMRMMLEGLYQRYNRMSDLEKLYDSTLEKYPQSVFWYYRAGTHYLKRKNLVKAQELSQKSWELSLESKQPNASSLELYLESLFQAQQYDKAMSVASGTIDTPLAATAYAFMGQIQFKQGQKDKAIASFNKALDKSESTDTALDGIMGVMLNTVGEDAVTAWISKQLAGNEKSLKAHILASSLAQRKGSYNEAIEHVSQCTEILSQEDPEWIVHSLRKVNLLIMAYLKTGDKMYFDKAINQLTEMLQVQPNNGSLMNNLAYLLTDNDQQLEMAMEYARKAHQGDPGNANYLDTYAYAQCKNGQFEGAEQSLLRAVQIYESSGEAIPWDLYEHFGMAKEGLGKTAEAIEMYQKALSPSGLPGKDQERLQAAIERLQQAE